MILIGGYLFLINNSKTELVSRYDSKLYFEKFRKQATGEAWKEFYQDIKNKESSIFIFRTVKPPCLAERGGCKVLANANPEGERSINASPVQEYTS